MNPVYLQAGDRKFVLRVYPTGMDDHEWWTWDIMEVPTPHPVGAPWGSAEYTDTDVWPSPGLAEAAGVAFFETASKREAEHA